MARTGFTIIETVVVIVILAILGLAMFLRMAPSDTVKNKGAARKVAGDVRFAQKLAISTQTRASVLFNATGYSVFTDGALANSTGDPCATDSSGKFSVNFTHVRCSEFAGVTLTAPAANPLAFDSMGTPVDNSTGAQLGAGQSIGVGSETVTVEAVSGRVNY